MQSARLWLPGAEIEDSVGHAVRLCPPGQNEPAGHETQVTTPVHGQILVTAGCHGEAEHENGDPLAEPE